MEKCPTTKKEVELELKCIVKEEAAIPSDVQGIKEDIGKKHISLMRPSGPALDHPASDMLLEYADNGCPVDCRENWSQEHIEAALLRGPHISAKSSEAIQVLRDETSTWFCKGSLIWRHSGSFTTIIKNFPHCRSTAQELQVQVDP